MTYLGLDRPEVSLDFPFVPFTFPSVTIARHYKKVSNIDVGWFYLEDGYSLYKKGIDSGAIKIPPAITTLPAGQYASQDTYVRYLHASADYLASHGFPEPYTWADAFAEALSAGVISPKWGYEPTSNWGVLSPIEGAFKGVGGALADFTRGSFKVLGESIGKTVKGLAKGIGVPPFLLWGVAVLIIGLTLYVFAKNFKVATVSK